MLQKLKNFWSNPYSAPLVDPLRNIGSTVAKAVSGYTEPIRKAFDDEFIPYGQRGKSRAARAYENLMDDSWYPVYGGMGMVFGGFASACGGGIVAFNAVAGGLATKIAATAVAGIAAGTLGAVAVPAVLAVGIAAGAVIVGTVLGVVPGVISGTAKAAKHHKALKNPPPAPAPAPAQKTVQDQTQQRIIKDFEVLDRQGQREVIEALEQKIGGAFDAVAKAADAALLDEDISVQPISTKLKRRNAAPAGGAAV